MKRTCVVDIETLDISVEAAIVAIGAVVFDATLPEFVIADQFYSVVNIEGQNRNICGDTLAWWMRQSEAARSIFWEERKVDLEDALDNFSNFCKVEPIDCIWSKPSTFDISILTHAYNQAGIEVPWDGKGKAFCLRTIAALFPEVKQEFVGTNHNALDDAVNEARWLHALLRRSRAAVAQV